MPSMKIIPGGRIFIWNRNEPILSCNFTKMSLCFQMRMSVHQAVTGVTRTLGVGTSSGLISVSATRASTETDTLVLVSSRPLVLSSTNTRHVKVTMLAVLLRGCLCLQTLMSASWATATANTTALMSLEGTPASVPQVISWTRMDTTAQVKHWSNPKQNCLSCLVRLPQEKVIHLVSAAYMRTWRPFSSLYGKVRIWWQFR